MSETALPLILALDISKRCTGVCWGRIGEAPRFMSIRGADMTDEAAMMRLGRWLIDFTKTTKPDWIWYEAALSIIPGEYDAEKGRVVSKGNPQTVITLAKMTAVVEFVAGMKAIQRRSANVQTARKVVLGQGRPREPKKLAMAMCKELGWSPKNEDEADAGIVWQYACLQVKPHAAAIITPMMQQRVASHAEKRRIGEDAGIF
jgi:hypothetical protein